MPSARPAAWLALSALLLAGACQTYDQATPHRNIALGGSEELCSGTEIELRARRALARAEKEEPNTIKVGELRLDLTAFCRKAGHLAEARIFFAGAAEVLEAQLPPGDPRRLELERQRSFLQ